MSTWAVVLVYLFGRTVLDSFIRFSLIWPLPELRANDKWLYKNTQGKTDQLMLFDSLAQLYRQRSELLLFSQRTIQQRTTTSKPFRVSPTPQCLITTCLALGAVCSTLLSHIVSARYSSLRYSNFPEQQQQQWCPLCVCTVCACLFVYLSYYNIYLCITAVAA